ncbi:MAG: hypothetical protein R6X25_12615 [Candidatus Krumholzibacteriia bacterium]
MSEGRAGAERLIARITANAPVSAGLLRLDLELTHPVDFEPGQFTMLNLLGDRELVFGRPFSILAADGPQVSVLYRVVGRGTALMAELRRGERMTFLGPLGRPFPAPGELPALLLAGGVGLPPLYAWWRRYARPGDVACFGARDGADVPWSLLDGWNVSVEAPSRLPAGRDGFVGLVTDLARDLAAQPPPGSPQPLPGSPQPLPGSPQPLSGAPQPAPGTPQPAPGTLPSLTGWRLLACGPMPLLRAVARWAQETGWPCLVSVEEHMGCGYGVCKGCVVPLRDPRADSLPLADRPFRPATSCEVGPVFAAEQIDWELFGRSSVSSGGDP